MNRFWNASKVSEKKVSILWKHMMMMLCILALALIALIISNRQSLNTLKKEHLAKYKISLDRDCSTLSNDIYATIAIPDGIEGTRYYDYIKSELDGVLDTKYYPVLNLLRKALQNQVYLRDSSDTCLLYFSGCNSIVTNEKNFPVAEDCFDRYLTFYETGSESILGYLRDKNTVKLIPMQPVKIGTKGYDQRMALIIHPQDNRVAVMSIYSEQTILEALGFSHFPEGTYLQMTSENGQQLCQYPTAISAETEEQCYRIESSLRDLNVSVSLWIPKAYFSQILLPVRTTGVISLLIVMLVGIALSFVLSKVSVRPLQQLITSHDTGNTDERYNEITHLDQLLRYSKRRSEDLQGQLFKQVLSRALSGSVLSEEDERRLAQGLSGLSENFRVAILHTTQEINDLLGDQMQTVLGQVHWVPINQRETGMVLEGSKERLELLHQEVARINGELTEGKVYCGISSLAPNLQGLHTAVRQARVALPQTAGTNLFPGERINDYAISWLQQERLYQSVFANDEESASKLLSSIARQTNSGNVREVFYNVRFVLRSAAEEMDIPLLAGNDLEYNPHLMPRENIQGLERMLHDLFHQIGEKNQEKISTRKERILNHIKQNYSDYNLCAPMVAETFEISEKRVYEVVRELTDMSFNEYLLSLRMKRAAYLLVATQESIAEIANQCGYQGSSTFYRVFKKYYGMPPGQYRTDGVIDS